MCPKDLKNTSKVVIRKHHRSQVQQKKLQKVIIIYSMNPNFPKPVINDALSYDLNLDKEYGIEPCEEENLNL